MDEQTGQQVREEQVEQREVLGGSLMFAPGREGGTTSSRQQEALQPPIKFPDTGSGGQYPILTRGAQGHYILWQTLDQEGLISKLPVIVHC